MVHRQILQQLHRYHSAGLCIRKGVMVVHEVISAGCGDSLQRMVGAPAAEVAAGGRARRGAWGGFGGTRRGTAGTDGAGRGGASVRARRERIAGGARHSSVRIGIRDCGGHENSAERQTRGKTGSECGRPGGRREGERSGYGVFKTQSGAACRQQRAEPWGGRKLAEGFKAGRG